MNARLTLDERAELDRLRRLKREMEEELQAWREAKNTGPELHDLQERFGFAPAITLVLAELVAGAPKAVSKDALLAAMRPTWQDRVDGPEIKIVDVRVCQLRRKLEGLGFSEAITTHWGFGYSMSADVAAALRPQRTEKAA